MRRLPALHLLEGPPEVLGRELLAVLVAKALAQPDLQGRLVDPGGLLHRCPDDVAPFVGPDRLLHRIPGDEQPVQRMRVDHLDGPDGSGGRRGCHDASLGQLPSGWHTRWSMGRTRSPRWMTSRWAPSRAVGHLAGCGSSRGRQEHSGCRFWPGCARCRRRRPRPATARVAASGSPARSPSGRQAHLPTPSWPPPPNDRLLCGARPSSPGGGRGFRPDHTAWSSAKGQTAPSGVAHLAAVCLRFLTAPARHASWARSPSTRRR